MKLFIRYFIIVSISLVLFSSCKKKNLNYQKVAKTGGIEILLLDVDDSRCPSDVNCFWEGNAEVLLRAKKGDQIEEFSLNTNSAYIQDTTVFNKHIELLDVKPYPISTETYSLGDYKINLKVTNV